MKNQFKISIASVLDIQHSPIQCLTLNEKTKKIALYRKSRQAPALEIWDISHLPYLEKILTDLERIDDESSVEGLVWAKDRLFSCGLHGFIVEHCLVTKRIKNKSAATSGPVWCITVNHDESLLAAGTEDGFINIFEINDECLLYMKVLDRQEGRVLSLCWSPCGHYVASGSIDSIRLWDVEKGHALQRMLTGRSKNRETTVWTVLMLDKFTIVSGDSRGAVSFWDAQIGVLRERVYTHKSDILILKTSPDKSLIYASGVDPIVVILAKVKQDKNSQIEKWVKSHQRNLHYNDVMCLSTFGNKLYSAGVDGDLVQSSYPPKKVSKYPPLPKSPKIHFSTKKGLMLVQNPKGIDIWQLPLSNNEDSGQLKLVELLSRGGEIIHSSSLSSGGDYFVYSTVNSGINVFRLTITSSIRNKENESSSLTPKLEKLKIDLSTVVNGNLDSDETAELHIDENEKSKETESLLATLDRVSTWSVHFVDETKFLAISTDLPTSRQLVMLYEINNENESEDSDSRNIVKLTNYFYLPKNLLENGINLISTSSNGAQLVLSDFTGGVFVLYLKEFLGRQHHMQNGHGDVSDLDEELNDMVIRKYLSKKYKKLPQYHCQASAFVFHPSKPWILVSYVDHSVKIFDYSSSGRGRILLNQAVGLNFDPEYPIVGGSWCESESNPGQSQRKGDKNKSKSKVGKDLFSVFLYDLDRIYQLEIKYEHEDLLPSKSKKRRKHSTGDSTGTGTGEEEESDNDGGKKFFLQCSSVKSCGNKYKFVAFAKYWPEKDELVGVEVSPLSLLDKLPPSFAKKRYGAGM